MNARLLWLKIAAALASLLASGCVASVPVEPPEPTPIVDDGPISPDSTGESLRLSAPASIVATVHEMLGDNGTITLSGEARKIVRDDITINVSNATSAAYSLTNEGGTITFAKPFPTVTAKLFAGIKVSPSLVKVVLNSDDTATAHVKSILGTHKRTFPLTWEATDEDAGAAAATNDKPVVLAYSTAGCAPCAAAKKAFAEATDLPFRVEWKDNAPAWVTSYPAFHWEVAKDDWRQRQQWDGLEKFVEMWRASRGQKKFSRTAAASASAVQSTPAIRYHAGHNCPARGTSQYSIESDNGSSHTHRCPKCRTAWQHRDQVASGSSHSGNFLWWKW